MLNDNALHIIKLYEYMVRVVLEYGCTISNPYYVADTNRIDQNKKSLILLYSNVI